MKTCKKGLHNYADNLIRCPECRKLSKIKWHKVNAKHQASKMKLYRENNAESVKANKKNWHYANLEHSRDMQLQYKYSISLEQYKQLLIDQNNVCAICNEPEKVKYLGKVKDLSVDHCHLTGKIRGLLCCNCNKGIGLLKDSLKMVEAAANYLRNSMDPDEILAKD